MVKVLVIGAVVVAVVAGYWLLRSKSPAPVEPLAPQELEAVETQKAKTMDERGALFEKAKQQPTTGVAQ